MSEISASITWLPADCASGYMLEVDGNDGPELRFNTTQEWLLLYFNHLMLSNSTNFFDLRVIC